MGTPARQPDAQATALIDDFLRQQGWSTAARTFLPGDFSSRYYVRLSEAGRPATLLMCASSPAELAAYIRMQSCLKKAGVRVPSLFGHDSTHSLALIEDLGSTGLVDRLQAGADEEVFYKKAVAILIRLAKTGAAEYVNAQLPFFNPEKFRDQVGLFLDDYGSLVCGRPFSDKARIDFLTIFSGFLEKACVGPQALLLRDYHAANIMVLPSNELTVIDFQDGGVGPVSYDLASLLEDTRRDIPDHLRYKMQDFFLAETGFDKDAFLLSYSILAVQRHLRVLAILAKKRKYQDDDTRRTYFKRTWGLLMLHQQERAVIPIFEWLHTHVPLSARDMWEP